MQRVAVIGGVGSGKSTFARALAERTSLPYVDLDDLYWRDGAVPSDEEWAVKHAGAIAADRWIMDGDHRAVAPLRFLRADTIVWLDVPTWRRVAQVLYRTGSDGSRLACLRWTVRYPHRGRVETIAALAELPAGTALHRLRDRRAQRRLLASI